MSYTLSPEERAELERLQLQIARKQSKWYSWQVLAALWVPAMVVWAFLQKESR